MDIISLIFLLDYWFLCLIKILHNIAFFLFLCYYYFVEYIYKEIMMVDFTNAIEELNNYSGSEKKKTLIYNN